MCGPPEEQCNNPKDWQKKDAPYDLDFDRFNHTCGRCHEPAVYCRCSVQDKRSYESDKPC